MFSASRASLAALLLVVSMHVTANDAPRCLSDSVEAHVRQQFATFGPLSVNYEYFGFIYRLGRTVDSAVVRGSRCVARSCVIDVARAAAMIPAGAVILGEWHTHPRNGEAPLSEQDVLGAYRNRNLVCYYAFYSEPDGAIYSWNPRRGMVTTAMASRVHVGNYPRVRGSGGTFARN
ncbi:MAG: hypothetical protein WDO72_15565 [Pseudomonadota bacterium]